MKPKVICKFVQALDDHTLIRKVDQELEQLKEVCEDIWVVSISHDVLTTQGGGWMYTALVTCEVTELTGEKNADREDEVRGSEAE